MRVVAHLSDLHFGRVDGDVLKPLVEAVWRAGPDLVVISGDFVQNGTRPEFEQARNFVRQLPRSLLTVPGNHDMPFLNLFQRMRVRFEYYREYICDEIEPFFADDEIAVMGVNTARIVPLRGGRINQHQVRRIEQTLCGVPQPTRILVTHHPFDLDPEHPERDLVRRARMAMGRLAASVDVLLAGHMHISQAGHTGVRYTSHGASAIFVQAGTATSARGRGEPNSFNLLRIDHPRLAIERHHWKGSHFELECTDHFTLDRHTQACAHH